MKITLDKIDMSYRDYIDFIIIYNNKDREILEIRDVAADIWRDIVLHDGITEDQIVERIASVYGCNPKDIVEDITSFLLDLYDSYVIKIDNQYKAKEVSLGYKEKSTDDYEGEVIQKMQEYNQLYSVTFEMTYACNERCIHCYANYPEESNKSYIISIEKYKEIIDDLYDMKCMHISFTGGDPFMYKGFFEVFEYARSRGFVCDIYTNALYISEHEETANKIIALRPRAFYISLYGPEAETHDKITCIPSSFDKTVKAVKNLRAHDVSVIFNIMLLSVNCEKIEDIVAFAKSLKADYRVGMSLIYKNNGDDAPMKYFINDKTKVKKVLNVVRQNFYQNEIAVDSKIQSEKICGAASSSLSVSPDGSVYPCISLKTKLGSIRENKISDIWYSKARTDFRDKIVWKNTRQCLKCKTRKECAHCIGISEAETGDMFSCNTCDKLISECMYELNHSV